MSVSRIDGSAFVVADKSFCRFELDPSTLWGEFDFRAIDWTAYGIADFDTLNDDRKLLLCMAAYYTDFDFDPLFKRGERQVAIDGFDLKDAVKLVQPIEKAALRGSILRAKAPEGGWTSCFKRVLDRIEGRCSMILRIPLHSVELEDQRCALLLARRGQITFRTRGRRGFRHARRSSSLFQDPLGVRNGLLC